MNNRSSVTRGSRLCQPEAVPNGENIAGRPLPGALREVLEWSLRADLRAVRVHCGQVADHAARQLGADAFASGGDIFFRADAYRPDTAAGAWLVAHEAAHLVQQARDGHHRGLSLPGDTIEGEADSWAAQVVAGRRARGRAERLVVTAGPCGAIQRHVSFEHQYLGDGRTPDLVAISRKDPGYQAILAAQIRLLDLWQTHPEQVTEQAIAALCPWIRVVRLGGRDGLLATYGELNALPDYLADHRAIDALGPDILLPILQTIRQEGFNQLTVLKGEPNPNRTFAHAASSPWKLSLINNIVETADLDEFTFGFGPLGKDHYQGLLARNACHFAPFSWHRWQATHIIARDLARRAHDEGQPELARQAWIAHGYADHFLQDSFAAGHLVNKMLIMQWFIEWAAGQKLLPIADWDAIKDMTSVKQPRIGGRALYDPHYAGASCDPQTAQEAANLVDRITASAIDGDGLLGQMATYRSYLTFLTSAATQLSSANLHDYYNARSLWVASEARPRPFEIWGDDTLLSGANGVDGVVATSETAQLSQHALRELLDTGTTKITTESIRTHFPTAAGSDSGSLKDLQSWAMSQRQLCESEIFPGFIPRLKELVVTLGSPRLGIVSQDQEFGSIWCRSLPKSSYAQVAVLPVHDRLFGGSNGSVYELDPKSGQLLWSVQVTDAIGVGDYTTRLAFQGSILFAGVHGYVYAVDTHTHEALWYAGVGNTGYHPVSVHVYGDNLFAGCNGYVYELNPANGKIVRQLLVASSIGVGDYETRLAVAEDMVIAGTHGYVYGIRRSDWSRTAWYAGVGHTGYNLPNVLLAGRRVFAGCNGYVYELNRETGAVVHDVLVTSVIGVGNYETRLAYDGVTLYVGVHGYVYGIAPDGAWSAAAWYLPVDGVTYQPVSVAATAGRVFAASNGSIYEVDRSGREFRHKLLLTYIFSVGDFDTQVATVGRVLFAGVHGYAYAVSVSDNGVIAGRVDLPDLPTPRQLAAAAASDTHVYLAGGGTMGPFERDVRHTFVRLSKAGAVGAAPRWEELPDLPTARWGACAAFATGRIWVIGGMQGRGPGFVNTVECFDPGNSSWHGKTAMPTARCGAAAVVVADQIFVSGGYQRLGQGAGPWTTHEVLDVPTGTWSSLPPLLAPSAGHGAAYIDGKTYVVAGQGTDQVYDHATRQWRVLGSQWPARAKQNNGGSAVAIGTRIFVFGDWGVMAPYSPKVWCFDTLDESWSVVEGADLRRAQGGAGTAALALPGGGAVVVLAGGATNQVNVQPIAFAESYIFE